MKRFWRVSFALFLMGAMVLAVACSGTNNKKPDDTKPATTEPAKPKEVTIRFGTWDSGDGVKGHNDIIKKFNEKFPHIKVQLESVPDDYGTKLLTQMSTGSAPDVFQIGDGDVGMYVKKGTVEDLSAYGIDKNLYYPSVYDVGVVDGKPYLLNKDFSPLAVYYNKTMFEKAGVPLPKDGWTQDEFLAAAKKLTSEKDKVWGVDLTGTWLRALEPWIWANGGKLISDDGKKYEGVMNSDATVKALQYYLDLYRVHKIAPMPADKEALKNIDLFETGKVAMLVTGSWPLSKYKSNPNLKFGVVGLPKGSAGATNVLCWAGFGVYSKSPNKKEAVEFLKFLAGPEGSAVFSKTALPAVKSVGGSDAFAKDEYNKVFLGVLDHVKPFGAKYNYLYGQSGEKFLGPAVEELLLKGGDVKAKLTDAAQKADKELKELQSK